MQTILSSSEDFKYELFIYGDTGPPIQKAFVRHYI